MPTPSKTSSSWICTPHFLRDDRRIEAFVRQREAVGNAGWNPELIGKRQTIVDLNWNNDFKEIFLDGDSKIVLIL